MVKGISNKKKKKVKKGLKDLGINLEGFRGSQIEKEILLLLSLDKEREWNVLKISKKIKRSYQATLRYADLLDAKGLINLQDYGNEKKIKFKEVKFESEKR